MSHDRSHAIVSLSSSIDALRATVEAQGGRLKDVESALSEYSDRLVRLEDTVSHLVKDNSRLRYQLDDLEFRSRRNNVRILNVPEKMELDDALTFVSSLLLESPPQSPRDHFFPGVPCPDGRKPSEKASYTGTSTTGIPFRELPQSGKGLF
ncbi:hypothetical protein DPEC_G00331400 [Dallia pectoralis]|uniref:Uncharacterized protein n=1 Tax=Dallia pectoralis TaxID=75939 RepID=A0ACC2F981_DALPE|nr:hypothetical protein DPEC_G00331400 [Dallia pectoralis]